MKTTLFLALAIGVILGCSINSAATKQASAEVFAACELSRTSATVTEQHCGELQDKYGIEYLCDQNNNLSTNHCWTEAK